MKRCAALLALAGIGSAAPIVNRTDQLNATRRESKIRHVVGGGGINSIWRPDSAVLEMFRGFPPGGVKVITSAGTNCESSGTSLVNSFANAGIEAEWIPICDAYCGTAAFDPEVVGMVESADAIFYGGGQSGRLQSCLYGDYSQSGIDVEEGATTPILEALIRKEIVGGSSAGAMNQPMSEILVTGHSSESYAVVRAGEVFQRNAGNRMLETEELVDSHFSERGRQGRGMMIGMQTNQRFFFGVDEDTSYIWRDTGVYEVVGEGLRDGIRGGVVVFESVTGTPAAQSGMMHFLTMGDTINPATGEIVYAGDKTPCADGEAPEPSNPIFSSVNYRTISLAMSRGPIGETLTNYHGSPAVEVRFTRIGTTVAMCGESGYSFENLLVEQFRDAQDKTFKNPEKPELPLDYIWQHDL